MQGYLQVCLWRKMAKIPIYQLSPCAYKTNLLGIGFDRSYSTKLRAPIPYGTSRDCPQHRHGKTEEERKKGKTPIIEFNLDKKQACMDFFTRYKDKETNSPCISKVNSMKELPSFIEENGSDEELLRVPSQYQPSPIVMDTINLQRFKSTPLKVTFSF